MSDRTFVIVRGGWTGLLLGGAVGVVVVAAWMLTTLITQVSGASGVLTVETAVGAIGLTLYISVFAAPVGAVVGLLCGAVTAVLATVAGVPDRALPWWGVAGAAAVWAVLWLAEPTGIVRTLTPWPPVGSPVLLVGGIAAAGHAVLVRRWRSETVERPA